MFIIIIVVAGERPCQCLLVFGITGLDVVIGDEVGEVALSHAKIRKITETATRFGKKCCRRVDFLPFPACAPPRAHDFLAEH